MKAIQSNPDRPLDAADAFELVDMAQPVPTGRDLLVRIEAISVNPIDTKMRQSLREPAILGWDAVGVVEEVGNSVQLFKNGDRVFYAGDIRRAGCNAGYQLVDERIVGRAPENISSVETAAMPLTTITAWEALFERMKITRERDAGKHLLIIGAAGGVGSMAMQLAKSLAGVQVVATASRTESSDWCFAMGAGAVVNHRNDLADEFRQQSLPAPDYIFCLNDTDHYFPVMADLIAPQGMICTVVSSRKPQNLNLLKEKSVGLAWEFMFTRSSYETSDMIRQHELLSEVASLLDSGDLRSTMKQELGRLAPDSLRQAHELLLTGNSVGKIVLQGFD
jgi:NADPH2:quinone reductase